MISVDLSLGRGSSPYYATLSGVVVPDLVRTLSGILSSSELNSPCDMDCNRMHPYDSIACQFCTHTVVGLVSTVIAATGDAIRLSIRMHPEGSDARVGVC
jgi:hypothetical protein